MVILRNWSITRRPGSPYTPPECCAYTFSGDVFGHPEFKDGDKIHTSKVEALDMDAREFVTHSGSQYRLEGSPAKEWSAFLFANGYSVDEFIALL